MQGGIVMHTIRLARTAGRVQNRCRHESRPMNRIVLSLFLVLTAGGLNLQGQTEATGTNAAATVAGVAVAPYLQVLSPESMAVLWQTAQPAYGWVEYGETQALGQKQDAAINGLRVANVTQQRVVLTGLRPGTTYWYRVCSKAITAFGPYKVEFAPEESSEPVPFKTLPSPRETVTAVIFNDLHNREATFRALREVVGATPFDFSLFNGDCLADPNERAVIQNILAVYNRGIQAASRPAVFVRGNHEDRGAFARDLPGLLAWPGDKPYFAFDAGSVRFVVLDCGEDKPDDNQEYSGLVDFTAYRQEETEWLKTEVASPAFQRAAWRVVVVHIPLFPEPRDKDFRDYSKVCQGLWGGLLANARIDLAISGHTHAAGFLPPGMVDNPYPVAIGGGPGLNAATVMILEADRAHLKLRMLNAAGGEVFPAFEKKH
jgi:Calcineurin-like phosphoesterase/Purple acid Phosphatase, N-terminal domain